MRIIPEKKDDWKNVRFDYRNRNPTLSDSLTHTYNKVCIYICVRCVIRMVKRGGAGSVVRDEGGGVRGAHQR